MLLEPVWIAAVIGVPPRVPTMLPPAAAPQTLPPLPPLPQQPGPPAPSPPPLPPTSMRILSNMYRVGLLNTQRNRFVPLTFQCHFYWLDSCHVFLADSGYSWEPQFKQILCVMYKWSRHQDYVKRLTPWGASVCLRTAPSSKTCAPWSESVKSKQHCVSRGENIWLVKDHAKWTSIQAWTLIINVVLIPTGYCFWDSKSKNLKSWRIRILSWSENFWLRVEAGILVGGGGRPIAHSWKLEGEQLSSSWAQCQHTGDAVGLALDRWAGKTKRETWRAVMVGGGGGGWGGLQDSVFVKNPQWEKHVDFL